MLLTKITSPLSLNEKCSIFLTNIQILSSQGYNRGDFPRNFPEDLAEKKINP